MVIRDLLVKAINQVGVTLVIQIITDSASNCKAAGEMIEVMKDYEHISWTPCAAHILDLYLEDVAKLFMIKDVINDARRLANFLVKIGVVHAIYNKYSSHALCRPGETRYGCMNTHMYTHTF